MAGGEAGAFGVLLRRYRQAAALSQEALAERAGISAVAVSALERGARRAPYLGTVELLASALALNPAERVALLAAARPSGGDPAALSSADALVPLVGRERELALLDRFLAGERAPLGPTPVLLLAGEPGIGKTRLLQAAAEQAIARGWCVLVGGCQRRGGQEPYAPLLEALVRYLQAVGSAQRRVALAGCAWLARLLPELAEDLEPSPAGIVAPKQERRLIHAAVARLLSNVAGPAGALLVLDDLQWAGPDALDLIGALARDAPAALRLVGAYRDTEVGPADPLGLFLADLAQAGLARQHPLGPLAADDAVALLENLLLGMTDGGRDLVEAVQRRAGGMPFFLVSSAQALLQGGAEGVPWDLAQGVRQRVALLPEAARRLLGVAAIVGRRAPRAVLVAAAGLPEEDALAGLEAACRARLLLEVEDDAYTFAHDLIREVVEADVGAARRAVLHRRVAEALERAPAGAPPEALAYHYGRSGLPDQAALYLERAGDHAWSQRAQGAAEGHYREALDALERLGRVPDALRVREKLSEVLEQTGRYGAVIAVLEPAADAFRTSGELERLGRVAAQLGWMHALRGTPHQGLALIQPLIEVLEPHGASPALAALYATRGQLLYPVGQYEASLAANERALALVSTGDDTRTQVRAAFNRLVMFLMLGRLADALQASEEVIPLAEAVGRLDTLLGVLRDVSYIHALRGAVAASRAYIERAGVVAERIQDPGRTAYTWAQRAWVAGLSGDWPEAHTALDEAVALSRQGDRSWYSAYPLIFRARLALAAGAWAEVTADTREAIALAERCNDLQGRRWASVVLAELDVLEGRPEAAGAPGPAARPARSRGMRRDGAIAGAGLGISGAGSGGARRRDGGMGTRAGPPRGDAARAGGGAARAGAGRAAPGAVGRGGAQPGGGAGAGAGHALSLRRGAAPAGVR